MRSSHPNRIQQVPGAWHHGLLGIGLIVLITLAPLHNVWAADTITLEYGALGRSIPVSSLETFVQGGVVDQNLDYYFSPLSSETRETLRAALGSKRQLGLVRIAQWLYEPMGVRLLKYTGQFIQTFGRENGWQGIRGAVIVAASDPAGFSVMDAIKNYPTGTIRLKLDVALANWNRGKAAVDQTLAQVTTLKKLSEAAAAKDPVVDLATLPDLAKLGSFPVVSQELMLRDANRNRTYPAVVYRPKELSALPGSVPVIVISHGFGDTRARFKPIAEHLASYGFLVALPEHIGSNSSQKEDLEAMRAHEAFQVTEFIDRPLDVKFLLDELERRNGSEFQGRLDLQKVAVMGHSFGGYTALAVAGATIDFATLQQQCAPDANVVGNLALLLECRALEVTAPESMRQLTDQSLADPRVKLVVALAPVTGLFDKKGISQITIPVAIMGGAYDIAAPLVPQQAKTFAWLTTSEKYLYMADKTSHQADLTRWINQLFNVSEDFDQSFEEGIQSFQGVMKSLLVALPQVYLQSQDCSRPFLTSAYVETLSSQQKFPIHLTRTLPPIG